MSKFYIALAVLVCGIAALCVILCISIQQKNTLQQQKDELIVQNVQLTKQKNIDISNAYKAGLITCGNEDVAFLMDTANEYNGTLFGRILRDWANGWAYDDSTLRTMVEKYMEGVSH